MGTILNFSRKIPSVKEKYQGDFPLSRQVRHPCISSNKILIIHAGVYIHGEAPAKFLPGFGYELEESEQGKISAVSLQTA